ncbi:MAG: beta-propeller domain-containing protein, partial [Candidatus Aenigmarchaeota archaeon]|nr:beta-propeller domain-containing protein [Candidatus Aenigmarchaeota archaeon]
IPGYSDYLHPYDENHIIGIGKDVDESIDADKIHDPNAVYYTAIQGVKLALFDVSDVANPIEVSKYVIGDRGTDSIALQDHKAFLFDKNKNLLVLPILLAEQKNKTSDYYGDYTFQGAYVFDVTLDNGFVLRGRITHQPDNDTLLKSGYYFDSEFSVKRSLYIGDVLYTISDALIKMNDLATLAPINAVTLPIAKEPVYYPGPVPLPMTVGIAVK